MSVQSLTALEAADVKAAFDRVFEALLVRFAPEPGPHREAVRYELAWRMRRVSDGILDVLTLATPPPTPPPGYWISLSRFLERIARGVDGAFDDELEPLLARGTPTDFLPTIPALAAERRQCARCGDLIAAGADAGEVCVSCRDHLVEEFERR